MTKIELVNSVLEILSDKCEDPAQAMIDHGQALIAIGKALKGLSRQDALSVVKAVKEIV
jgi:hypothetical protein